MFIFCCQMFNETPTSIVETLKKANSILPHVVLASTVLALLYPPSFTWFTSRFSSLYTVFVKKKKKSSFLLSCSFKVLCSRVRLLDVCRWYQFKRERISRSLKKTKSYTPWLSWTVSHQASLRFHLWLSCCLSFPTTNSTRCWNHVGFVC